MNIMKTMAMLGLWAVVATGCTHKKADKTCKGGHAAVPLVAPWTDLGVAQGEVCKADATELTFIAKHQKDPIAFAEAISAKLAAKGWKPVEGTMDAHNYGKGGQAYVMIYGWQHVRGDKKIVLEMDSFPPEMWNDDPVEIDLTLQ